MALSIDATATGTGVILNDGDSVTTGTFSTTAPDTLLLALIAYNGDPFLDFTVTGGDLDWQFVDQETTLSVGACFAYMAWAPSALTDITATFTVTGANTEPASTLLSVIAISGVDTSSGDGWSAIGASNGADNAPGVPSLQSVSLTTTLNNSWVFAIGNAFSGNTARTLGTGQTLIAELPYDDGTDTSDGWVQRLDDPTPDIGTAVTLNTTAPSVTGWKMLAIEVLPPDTRTDPVITWDTPSPILTTTPISTDQLSATANVSGSFEYSVTSGDFLSSGLQTIVAVFTPDDPGSYRSAFAFVTIAVSIPNTPTFMQGIALAANTHSPLAATFDAPITVGNTGVLVLSHSYLGCSPPSSVTDNLGNVWTRCGTGQTPGGNQYLWIYTAPITVGGACTMTLTFGCGICQWAYATEWSGLAADPYDGSNVQITPGNSATGGSVTTSQDGGLILSAWSFTSWTAGSGTIILTDDVGNALQMEIQPSAGPVNPSATTAGAGATYQALGFAIAFKAAPAAAHDYTQDLDDSVSLAEVFIRGTGKHATDFISLAELIHSAVGTSRVESITMSDAIAKRPGKVAIDSVTLAESIVKQPGKSLLDSVSLSDLYSRTLNKLYSFVDSISISDFFDATKARLLQFVDSISLSDLIIRAANKAVAETLTLVEHASKAASHHYADAFSLTDLFSTTKARVLAIVDSLDITDSLSKATQRIHADALTLLDFLDLSGAKLLSFIDSLDITDSIRKATGKVVTEAFTPIDSIKRVTTRTFRDSITILDSITSTVHSVIRVVRKFLVEVWQRAWTVKTETRLWPVDQPLRKWSTSINMIHTQKDPASSETFTLDWISVADSGGR